MGILALAPVHPGEILKQEFLEPLGMSAGQLARKLHVPRTRIERLVSEVSPVTVDTALRFARYFGRGDRQGARLEKRFRPAL